MDNVYTVDESTINRKLQLGMFAKQWHGLYTNKEWFSYHWNGKEWIEMDYSSYWRPSVFEE